MMCTQTFVAIHVPIIAPVMQVRGAAAEPVREKVERRRRSRPYVMTAPTTMFLRERRAPEEVVDEPRADETADRERGRRARGRCSTRSDRRA